MRYVSNVNIDFGGILGRARYRLIGEKDGDIVLSDGTVVFVQDIKFDDYLGAGPERNGLLGVVVALAPHEALLHKYVLDCRTIYGAPEFMFPDEDLGVICEGALIGRGNNAWRGEKLGLNTTNECIEVSGVQGSVAIRTESPADGFPKMYNLYQLLAQLCYETGINLMSYKRLRLYSPGRGYETIIHFDQSIEARRFFTKMYFEICR